MADLCCVCVRRSLRKFHSIIKRGEGVIDRPEAELQEADTAASYAGNPMLCGRMLKICQPGAFARECPARSFRRLNFSPDTRPDAATVDPEFAHVSPLADSPLSHRFEDSRPFIRLLCASLEFCFQVLLIIFILYYKATKQLVPVIPLRARMIVHHD